MEFGEFLRTLQSPNDKFKTAVSTNNLTDLLILIDDITDVNMVIETQLGRRALHLACRHGNSDMIQLLLQKGADPLIADSLGYLPWHMAFNSGLQKGLRLILSTSPCPMPASLWKSVVLGQHNHPSLPGTVQHNFIVSLQTNKTFALANSLISTFVKAVVPLSPNSPKDELTNSEAMLSFYSNIDVIVKLYVLCGNFLPKSSLNTLLPRCSEDTNKWLDESTKNPWSLQALCRVAIRRSFCFNAFYSVSALDLPDMIKAYLAFNFDDEYELNVMPHLPIWPHIWRGRVFADQNAAAFN